MRWVSNSILIYNLIISYDPLVHPREKNWSDRLNDTEFSEKNVLSQNLCWWRKKSEGRVITGMRSKTIFFIDKLMDCEV